MLEARLRVTLPPRWAGVNVGIHRVWSEGHRPGPGAARAYLHDLAGTGTWVQMIVHLRDLERLRELTEPYVTDSGAGYRDDAFHYWHPATSAVRT